MDLAGSCNKHSKKGTARKNVNLADRKPGQGIPNVCLPKDQGAERNGKIVAPLGGASRCDPA